MPRCIDCLNFKMLKGWKKAVCKLGNLGNDVDRTFLWESSREQKYNAKIKNGKLENLLKRGEEMQVLNPKKCSLFNSAI